MRVLVVGAGFVGSRLAEALQTDGHEVFATRRSAEAGARSVTTLCVDMGEPESFKALPEAIDQVYFTVAPDEPTEALYDAIYVQGPRRLLEAETFRRSPPARVVFTSSTAVYGQQDGAWVDEASPTEPVHFTGRLMLEAERALQQVPSSVVALRCSGIYGPGRGRLLDRIRRGEARFAEGTYTNRIHVDDVVGALLHVGLLGNPLPVYVASDRDPAPQETVYRWLAARLGAPPPEPASTARSGRSTNKRCRPTALLASGFAFRYPTYREGYGAILGPTDDPVGPTG